MSQEKPEKEEWWIKEMRDIEEQKGGGGTAGKPEVEEEIISSATGL